MRVLVSPGGTGRRRFSPDRGGRDGPRHPRHGGRFIRPWLVRTGLVRPGRSPQGRGLAPGDRLLIRTPDPGAVQQGLGLLKHGDAKDAALLARMEATPQAVWLTGGTPAQVTSQVHQTLVKAALQRAVPVFVAYDIPGRDCAQFSAGGALNEADYDSWVSALAAAVGHQRAVVLLEPDSLGLLPSTCGAANYPFTDTERYAELNFAVTALEKQPGHQRLPRRHAQRLAESSADLLRACHRRGAAVPGLLPERVQLPARTRADRLRHLDLRLHRLRAQPRRRRVAAGRLRRLRQPVLPGHPERLQHLGPEHRSGTPRTWAARWRARTSSSTPAATAGARTAWPPTPPHRSTSPRRWSSALASGNWCNPPGAGLGLRPTTSTGVPLLDARLWVKTPGESDGQCDAAGNARAWDYSAYSQPGWPADAASQALFDPLWGTDDPAAGAWFPQQALQLARDADPPLPSR